MESQQLVLTSGTTRVSEQPASLAESGIDSNLAHPGQPMRRPIEGAVLYQSYRACSTHVRPASCRAIVAPTVVPMGSEYKKLLELESAVKQLRDDLNGLSIKVNAEPRNTSLLIRRVNVMGRIMTAQTTLDRLRDEIRQR